MKNKIILIAALGLFLSACCTEKSALRYLKNHPEVVDSMSTYDTVYVSTQKVDTSFIVSSDTVSLVDTFYHDNIRVILRQDTVNFLDTIELLVTPDTLKIEVPVTQYIIKDRSRPIPPFKKFLMWLGVAFIVIAALSIIKRLS